MSPPHKGCDCLATGSEKITVEIKNQRSLTIDLRFSEERDESGKITVNCRLEKGKLTIDK